ASENKAECSFQVWIKNTVDPRFEVTCPDPTASTISVSAETDLCDAEVTVPAPVIDNLCVESFSVSYQIDGGTSVAVTPPAAVGTVVTLNALTERFEVGTHTVTWTIVDASGNVYTCVIDIEVIDLPPFVDCPDDYVFQADFDVPYKENITVADPTYGDNCPNPVLEWTLVEPDGTTYTSANTGINILPNPRRYYVGVTTITYKITDSSGLTDDCSFTVTVKGPPKITCPPDYTTTTDPGVCTATRNSEPQPDGFGLPTLDEGIQPITWYWTITYPAVGGNVVANGSFVGSASNPGPPDISDYPFEIGESLISWRAENISGYDECSHLVIVQDKEAPTLDADPYENCVDPLHWVVYNEANPNPVFNHIVPNLEKFPVDYRTLYAGDTSLDLTSLEDNCCDSLSMVSKLQWRIEFADTPDPLTGVAVSHADITGTGQPSTYTEGGIPTDIYLWGDGVTFSTVTHHIFYWVEDCNGNPSGEIMREITITPRPQVIKTDY
ncbi:HYR domain-containing protein, partial [Maribellus sp. YY47]|uniref:HYR domain-containing protein n=1 Tax=Maribellus sp. YY47 TaxID=2929486 RepID=UPI0020008EC0